MGKRENLLNKLYSPVIPKNFTVAELDSLMKKCNCIKGSGGRGSAIKYYHEPSKKILIFDGPHPGKELYIYQVQMVKKFLIDVNEYKKQK